MARHVGDLKVWVNGMVLTGSINEDKKNDDIQARLSLLRRGCVFLVPLYILKGRLSLDRSCCGTEGTI